MNEVFVRSPYNYDVDAVSEATGLDCSDDPSMAKQSFAEECDINTIVRQFGVTGQLPDNVRAPQYGDFVGIGDYQSALNAVIAADESFMQMPASIRDRFHNSAALFVEFCSNPDNLDEMRKMGLAVESPPTSSINDNGSSVVATNSSAVEQAEGAQ